MKKKIRKFVTYCVIAAIAFIGNAIISQAAENSTTTYNAIARVSSYVNIRNEANAKSKIIGKLYNNSSITVVGESGGWSKVKLKTGTGFIKSDYLVKSSKDTSANNISSKNTSDNNLGILSMRLKLVNYALRFKGNPYVWGGTSLTNGADCSGFTQSVFRDNGIYISRTSRTQASGGKRISIKNIQRGDLIFYDRNGRINHVGIYIGNGKVISASSPKTGIRITSYNYRQPYKVVSYIS